MHADTYWIPVFEQKFPIQYPIIRSGMWGKTEMKF